MSSLVGLGQFWGGAFGFFGGLGIFFIGLGVLWYLSLYKQQLEKAGKI